MLAELDCTETYYSPARVRGWLGRWAELVELAQPTTAAIRYDSPGNQWTPGQRPGDPQRYCDVLVDIERAWITLPRWSLEACIVEWLMRGYSVETVADELRVSYGAAYRALSDAAEAMARRLGWVE